MRVAFYAPMKAPGHARPSGDRRIARLLIRALERAGHQVTLASIFRSWDGAGDAARQARLGQVGQGLARRLVRRWQGEPPHCWFTYHLYHKAPDWLGPYASQAFAIPYVIAEASHAAKQATGPRAFGHAAAREAIARAQGIVALNAEDLPGVRELISPEIPIAHVPPFLDEDAMVSPATRSQARARLVAAGVDPKVPWLVTVGMMRPGNKVESYRVLSATLDCLRHRRWRLLVLGDGAAYSQVRGLYAGLESRVHWLGLRSPREVSEIVSACDLFLWPAVREPLGLAILEAQAAGVAVVVGPGIGVGEMVSDGVGGRLVPLERFSATVAWCLDNPEAVRAMGVAGRAFVAGQRSLEVGARSLDDFLRAVQMTGPVLGVNHGARVD